MSKKYYTSDLKNTQQQVMNSYTGIRTDFMDVEMKNYSIENLD